MGTGSLFAFLIGTVVVLSVPGPSVLFVVARTVEGGRTAGLVSVAGLETGLTLHVFAATIGLSALVASSESTMTVLRYLGAGYLALLAARQVRSLATPHVVGPAVGIAVAPDRRRLFREAFVVDALNPKTGLFFLAFLPQFVDPEGAPAAVQVFVLGSLVVGVAMVCDTTYVVASSLVCGRTSRQVHSRVAWPRVAARTTSAVYAGLAVLTVLG